MYNDTTWYILEDPCGGHWDVSSANLNEVGEDWSGLLAFPTLDGDAGSVRFTRDDFEDCAIVGSYEGWSCDTWSTFDSDDICLPIAGVQGDVEPEVDPILNLSQMYVEHGALAQQAENAHLSAQDEAALQEQLAELHRKARSHAFSLAHVLADLKRLEGDA